MLDVHPPHESVHNWRDFILHLVTITIGLFIALSMEGLLEWHHHRELVHEAEASLHDEIKSNASGIDAVLADLHQKQANLKKDVVILNAVAATGKYPADRSMSVDFRIVNFDSVSWATAQSEPERFSYMPLRSCARLCRDLCAAGAADAKREAGRPRRRTGDWPVHQRARPGMRRLQRMRPGCSFKRSRSCRGNTSSSKP